MLLRHHAAWRALDGTVLIEISMGGLWFGCRTPNLDPSPRPSPHRSSVFGWTLEFSVPGVSKTFVFETEPDFAPAHELTVTGLVSGANGRLSWIVRM
jgi:hypothetical protein